MLNRPYLFSFILLSVLSMGVIQPSPAFAYHKYTIPIEIRSSDGTFQSSFSISLDNDAGGVTLAVADLGTDGIPEILVGNGLGNEPRVRVFREDGSEIGSFLAYAPDMGSGITIAACDLNTDGQNEIVTGTQYGGGPHVRVFDHLGNPLGPGFFAYAETFRGGVNVACGDLDGDGVGEIITGAGVTGGPHVRVWTQEKNIWNVREEFFAFDPSDRRGVLVHTTHDGNLLIASQRGATIQTKTFVIHSTPQLIYSSSLTTTEKGTTSIAEANDSFFFSFADSETIFSSNGSSFSATSLTGSSELSAGDLDGNGTDEFVLAPARPLFGPEGTQYILIDLSEQRLYAYENTILAHTFLVSTARTPWETPLGKHEILAKIPVVDYTWSYGPGDPNNYSLGPTPWNLRIYPHVYIHYAWWHNNFGHPMSHGCVNVNLANIKWIYDWANVGTPVEVRT
jgi:hypothetical protein